MPKFKRDFRFMVCMRTVFSITQLTAEIVYPAPDDGELINLSCVRWNQEGFELKDLQVSMYLATPSEGTAPFGLRHEFFPGYTGIDLRFAKAMTATMRRLDKGLARLDQERGRIECDDFATYLIRVAEILGVAGVYHLRRNGPGNAAGERHTTVDDDGLRTWVSDRVNGPLINLPPRGTDGSLDPGDAADVSTLPAKPESQQRDR